MTALSLHTAGTPPRLAWRSLLWTVPVTVLWTLLITWQPGIPASGVPIMALRLMIHGLLALGLWLGLERTDLTPDQRRTTWLAIMIPYTLWAAIAWSAVVANVFRPGAVPFRVPLLPLAIFVPVIVGAPLLLLSKRVGRLLDAMPATWLIALQLSRVFGSVFLAVWLGGQAPGLFALPAGIGDVLTGLFALPAALAVATGTAQGWRAGVTWNIFGLADYAVATTMGMITSAGPLQLIVPSISNIGAVSYPTVLIPAYAVPSAILLHLLSLRQLRRRAAAR
jgi:hypothetical protein